MQYNDRIGISFSFPASYSLHLSNIFNNINYLEYTWYVSDSEILYHNEKTGKADNSIFVDGVYSGDSFRNIISNNVYCLIHARIFAVPKDEFFDVEAIVNFASYLNSNCEIALLCADYYVDFYAKDNDILDKVKEACICNSYERLSDIIAGNDGRTSFHI